jgi:hypothetical protein
MSVHPKETLPGRAPRFDLQLTVRFRPEGDERWREGFTRNISRSGVLFASSELLGPSTQLEMLVELPGRDVCGVVSCRGTVVRVEPRGVDEATSLAATISSFRLAPRDGVVGS